MDMQHLLSHHGNALMEATHYVRPDGTCIKFAVPVLHATKENVLIILGTRDHQIHRSAAGTPWDSANAYQILLQEGLLKGAEIIDKGDCPKDEPVIKSTAHHHEFVKHPKGE